MTSLPFNSTYVLERPASRRLSLGLIACLVIFTVVRLLAAAAIPLTEDEAYYRLWAQHVAFGYFDHPPMVAWWIAIGQAAVGDNPLGARLLSVFATTFATVLIVEIGVLLGLSRQISERAGIWYNAMLLIGPGGGIITPDAPATFFWTLSLWMLAKSGRPGARAWWLGAGAAAGLATLSKYSALFIGPGVLLWLLASPKGRGELRRPWPWLALGIGALVFAPNLLWNAGHHWLSLSKQFSRVAPTGFTPLHALDFPATQLLLINPFIAVFAIKGLCRFRWSIKQAPTAMLVLTAAPFAAYLALHSLHAGVQAHWPAPLYPTIALLAAEAADGPLSPRWRWMARLAPWLGFSISALALAHMASPQTDWIARKDPVMALRGWPLFAGQVEALRLREQAGWVGTFSYGAAAELIAQRQSPAPIIEVIERARYAFQGDVAPPQGAGLVVDLARRFGVEDLAPCFGEVRRLQDLLRGDAGRPGLRYSVYLVTNPKVDIIRSGCRVGKDRTP